MAETRMRERWEYRVIYTRAGREIRNHKGDLLTLGPTRHVRKFGTEKAAEKFKLVILGRGDEAYGLEPGERRFDGQGPRIADEYREKFEKLDVPPVIDEPQIEKRRVLVEPWPSEKPRQTPGDVAAGRAGKPA